MNMKKHIGIGAILLILALFVVSEKTMADPGISWNTFLGSASNDYGYAIAVDGSENVYMAGLSEGSWGSPVNSYSGMSDAFAVKLITTISLSPILLLLFD